MKTQSPQKHCHSLLVILLLGCWLNSCSTKDEFSTSPQENYNAAWEILDRGYCYFDLKLPPDSSWRDMHQKHLSKISAGMSTDSLFRVITELMAELKDGHVNLSTPFDIGRYWAWRDDHPSSLNIYVRNLYLGKNYRIAGSLQYEQIKYNGHGRDSIALIVYSSFSSPIGHGNIDAALSRLRGCKALIIDIRDNGGGNLSYSDILASHFFSSRRHIGYMRHKTGAGHNDFSPRVPIYLDPTQGVRWLRPVVLLTDRGVYSSANDFAMKMKDLPLVTLMGDRTGGGGGLPKSAELPNGWGVRYSSGRMTDAQDEDIELGIAPHYYTQTGTATITNGLPIDSLIEEAIAYINDRYAQFKQTGRWEK